MVDIPNHTEMSTVTYLSTVILKTDNLRCVLIDKKECNLLITQCVYMHHHAHLRQQHRWYMCDKKKNLACRCRPNMSQGTQRNIYLSNKITTGTFSNSQWKETKILLPVLLHGIIKLLHNNREWCDYKIKPAHQPIHTWSIHYDLYIKTISYLRPSIHYDPYSL